MTSRARFSIALVIAAIAAVIAFAGCGGGGDSTDSGASADPVTAAPAGSPLFVEATIKPTGDEKTAIDSLVDKATNGKVDPGAEIIKKINDSFASDPSTKDLTYEDNVEPWLGEKAGIAFQKYNGQDFTGVTAAVQVTDEGAAQDFLDKAKDSSSDPVKNATYKGVDYVTTSGSDPASLGITDGFLVIGETPQDFESVVDTLQGGKSLEDDSNYSDAVANAPDGSVADVYVDIGALIKQSGDQVDQQVLDFYNAIGTDFSNSKAVASLVPTANSVEVDVATDAGSSFQAGDASQLIGSFPKNSFAAFGVADVGKQIEQVLDGINAVGFPPEVPKGALYSTFKKAGVDIKGITSKIGDVGLFANGSSLVNVGGALVATTDSAKTASDSVKSFTVLLKRAQTPGFTVLKGQNGFQIVDAQLPKPLVIVSAGDRIAAGLGLAGTLAAAEGKSPGGTLSEDSTFKDAKAALGDTTLSGYINLKPIIELAQLSGDASTEQAVQYLKNFDYAVFGSGTSGDFATSRFILSLGN